MPKIFISYRRDETAGYAGRIHERFASIYGTHSVFMDIDDIRAGADFVTTLDQSISTCDVMLVLIGKRWLDAENSEGQRRLDDPKDFVRIEVTKALRSKVRVIPVLLSKASMPSEHDLPHELKALARRQAFELSDERWDYDFAQLAKEMPGRSSRRMVKPALAAGIALAVVLAVSLIAWNMRSGDAPVDISGRWTAVVPYEFSTPQTETFQLNVSGIAVRGSATFLHVGRAIAEGKIERDEISFVTRTSEGAGNESREAVHRYQGKIAGDHIDFVVQTEGGFSEHPPIAFTARRMKEGQ